MRYPGGKGKSYQRIINLMPPHRIYIESHLGGGAVLRNKRPAAFNIGIDIDPEPLGKFKDYPENYKFVCDDAISALRSIKPTPETLIYADPPYLPQTRRAERVYQHDYSEQDHVMLLTLLQSLRCMVMISGYPSKLYDRLLGDWTREEFVGVSHVGPRSEVVWMNFKPRVLHDVRFVGHTFREREANARQRRRWKERFQKMKKANQQALLADLFHAFAGDLSAEDLLRAGHTMNGGVS